MGVRLGVAVQTWGIRFLVSLIKEFKNGLKWNFGV